MLILGGNSPKFENKILLWQVKVRRGTAACGEARLGYGAVWQVTVRFGKLRCGEVGISKE